MVTATDKFTCRKEKNIIEETCDETAHMIQTITEIYSNWDLKTFYFL